MILYFTGTGNSFYTAKRIASELKEPLRNIVELVQSKEFTVRLGKGEKLGFVFPVYYYGVPTIIADFISKMQVEGSKDTYSFAVITCGGSIGGAGGMFERMLAQKGYHIDLIDSVLMPDNYVLLYNLPTKEKAMEILKNSELLINELIPKLKAETRQSVTVSFSSKLYTKSLYFLYQRGRKTKRFYTDSNCVSCGLCAKICPQKAIEMDQGKPQWTKKQCVQCLACIHRCPSAAIQYGKGTRKRNRYVNPILGKE